MPLVKDIVRDENKGEAFVEVESDTYHITMSDLLKSSIAVGDELDGEKLGFLGFADSKLSGIKKAFVFLSYGDMSERKLRTKLEKSFEPDVVSAVVELMIAKRYIDDEALSIRMAEAYQRSKLYGKAKIRSELFMKGFSAENISNALSELDESVYEESILTLLEKKCADKAVLADFNAKKKLSAYLFRLGFSYDEIVNAMERFERG